MSKRPLLILAIGLATLQSRAAFGQVASREADSLLQQVRILDSVMLARARAVDSVRRLVVRPIPPVDIQRGPLHVRTDSVLATRVRAAVDSVVGLIDRRGGTLFAQGAAAHVPTITRDSTRSIVGMLPMIAINADTMRRWSAFGQRQVRSKSSTSDLASGLGEMVEQFAMQGVDSSLAAWVMLGRAPLRPMHDAEQADAYIELATTESTALRRCRSRDIAACLDALGIDSLPASRLERWYAPGDYRSVIRNIAPPATDSVAVAAWLRCRESGNEGACRTAALAIPNERVPLPFSAAARFTFLREVLDAGGPGSFDRLVATPGTIRERLTAASQEPLEKTIPRWLDRVEGARPNRMRVSGTLLIASLGWTTTILGLALVRRTSWA